MTVNAGKNYTLGPEPCGMHNRTNWRPNPAIERTEDGYETWTHTAPHEINEGEVDGDVDLSDLDFAGLTDDADDDSDE